MMKHVFILNPKAGPKSRVEEMTSFIKENLSSLDYEIYVTKAPKDATTFTKNYLKDHPNIDIRFYSLGGDGTLNEIASSLVGVKRASIVAYPLGSGNDFIKVFGRVEDFKDLKELTTSPSTVIDCLMLDNLTCVNIVSFGFDASVQFQMQKYRRLPLTGGKTAYNMAVLNAFLFRMKYPIEVYVDNKLFFDGKALLMAVANGICYGGGYFCAPKAEVNDGLIDVCLVSKVSKLKIMSLIKVYKNGKHLDEPKLEKYVHYTKAKDVYIKAKGNKEISYQVDGEPGKIKEMHIKILKDALNFVIPSHLLKNN